MKVFFIHGYQSSKNTNKFTVIETDDKICLDVDYDKFTFKQLEKLYFSTINEYNPDIIVGHSLGAFWSLLMSQLTAIPCVIINPQFTLTKFEKLGYPQYVDWSAYFNGDNWVYSYIETGDEIINVSKTVEVCKKYSDCTVYQGGHHRVENLNNINKIINNFRLDRVNFI
jgi:predicted esterase YcpF (UPF0227 family)